MKHETKTNNGIDNTQTVNRLARKRVTFESCSTRVIKEGINLYISNHSRARRHNIKVSNTFIGNIISCPSRANACRFKNISCKRNKPKQYTNTWQITEVSNSTERHVHMQSLHNSGNHDLLKFAIAQDLYGSTLL